MKILLLATRATRRYIVIEFRSDDEENWGNLMKKVSFSATNSQFLFFLSFTVVMSVAISWCWKNRPVCCGGNFFYWKHFLFQNNEMRVQEESLRFGWECARFILLFSWRPMSVICGIYFHPKCLFFVSSVREVWLLRVRTIRKLKN